MKLDGIRVIDLSVFLPGPHLTMMMADHGAEVIKIEPPGDGDPGRHIGLSQGGHTTFFRNANRGKKSVVLDLKDPAQREVLLGLCESADVFVEAFRPGVVERLGVDYPAVAARNPRIVYASLSAFGQTGPVFVEKRPPVPKHERTWGGAAFYRIYRTRDARHIVLGAQEPKFVRNLREAFDDLHVRARGMLVVDEAGIEHLGVPIRFADEPARPSLKVPALGEHSELASPGRPPG